MQLVVGDLRSAAAAATSDQMRGLGCGRLAGLPQAFDIPIDTALQRVMLPTRELAGLSIIWVATALVVVRGEKCWCEAGWTSWRRCEQTFGSSKCR
jgi:hypothetical protein